MDERNSEDHTQPHFLFYVIPAYLTVLWLLFIQPLLLIAWLFVVCPILVFCRPRLKKVYKYITKIVTSIFRFVHLREVKDEDGIKVPRFILFGYLAPPVFTYYLFFLCVVTVFYTLAAFWNAFLIDITDICSPYDEYNCFTSEGEMISKPLERPTNSSDLTCFNQTKVNCFMFVYHTEEGVAVAAALLTLSWIIILSLTWLILKCSGGQGSGCFLPCCCCPRGRCWCSCGCRCIVTLFFQGALLIIPQCFVLAPFYDNYIALLFKNYFNLDTTGEFLSSDSLKLLHISSMLMYGVFVPWCWFKKVPPEEANQNTEEREAEAGQQQDEAQVDNAQGLKQVYVSNTGGITDSLDMEVFHV